jgi:hypothetical protein
MNQYDWQVFHGGTFDDPNTIPDAPKSWWGDHNSACGSPTTLREVHVHAATPNPAPVETIGEMAWWCGPTGPDSGHFMTAVDSIGYSSVALTPKVPLSNVRKICWDMSLNDVAGWWLQLDVIPLAQWQADGGDLFYQSPGLGGEVAFNANHLDGSEFMFEMLRGSTHTYVGTSVDDPNFANIFHIPGFPIHDRAARYKHCIIDNENGTIRAELYGRTGPGSLEVRNHRGAIPNGAVKVIFEHSSYHNSKDSAHYDAATQNGKTLGDELTTHWDNVQIFG